jgi:hydrogenase nickel incorporation protein HypB
LHGGQFPAAVRLLLLDLSRLIKQKLQDTAMEIYQPLTKSDEQIALDNRRHLQRANVFAVNLIGGPGCGKTTLISQTVQQLMLKRRIGIITADPFTHRDADRVSRLGSQFLQIDPGYNRMLGPRHLQTALRRLNLTNLDMLLIENISSLIGPGDIDLGEDAKVCMFSIAAGDDKAAKFPDVVRPASLVLLNKMDLLSVMPFDIAAFESDVRRVNPTAEIVQLSTRTGEDLERWLEWLLSHSAAKEA